MSIRHRFDRDTSAGAESDEACRRLDLCLGSVLTSLSRPGLGRSRRRDPLAQSGFWPTIEADLAALSRETWT